MEITQEKVAMPLNRKMLSVLFLLGIVAASIRLYASADSDSTGYSWLIILALIQITPFVTGMLLGSPDYIGFILMSHFAGFTLAKWNDAENLTKSHALTPSWIFATKHLIICTFLMAFSYYLCRTVLIPNEMRRKTFNDLTLSKTQLRLIALYVFSIPFIGEYLPYSLLIIHFAMASAQILLIICAQAPKAKGLLLAARIMVPVVSFIYFLRAGMLTMLANYTSFLFIYSFLKQEKKFFVSVIALVFILSAIQSVKGQYRLFSYGVGENSSLGERFGVLGTLLNEKYIDKNDKKEDEEGKEPEKDESSDTALMRGFSRVGDDSLERVLAMTPSVVPFWKGETYQSIPYMFIPRSLWPDKPGRNFWNKFGREYRVLSSNDFETSVGVGFFAEAYMNFGFWFMYLLAAAMGFLIVVVERIACTMLLEKFFFSYITFLGPFIGLGADLGSILNSTAILGCCMFVARPFLLRLAQRDDYS